ncbi:alpha/beta fold hydrolase, partial [Amycolatopsis rhizosphaerae]|uniref:alpha/beta fold hydrolase n=1 Tax=Amycolatopsis rhizosphaerae TaxID=2053003 RepID=UPI003CCC7199
MTSLADVAAPIAADCPEPVALRRRAHPEQVAVGLRWRERLGEITAPTLVLHGEDDPFFPIGKTRRDEEGEFTGRTGVAGRVTG